MQRIMIYNTVGVPQEFSDIICRSYIGLGHNIRECVSTLYVELTSQ